MLTAQEAYNKTVFEMSQRNQEKAWKIINHIEPLILKAIYTDSLFLYYSLNHDNEVRHIVEKELKALGYNTIWLPESYQLVISWEMTK